VWEKSEAKALKPRKFYKLKADGYESKNSHGKRNDVYLFSKRFLLIFQLGKM
jgi:hypothetical protein